MSKALNCTRDGTANHSCRLFSNLGDAAEERSPLSDAPIVLVPRQWHRGQPNEEERISIGNPKARRWEYVACREEVRYDDEVTGRYDDKCGRRSPRFDDREHSHMPYF